MNKTPLISVIMPVYNGEKRLPKCLKSIRKQDYPQDKIEIIIVDDDSSDHTVELAKSFGCVVTRNGSHNPERGKSIGIEQANGEYLFFIDDDNILTKRDWLSKLVDAVVSEDCVGGQAAWFQYSKKASLPDKYMALYGCGDPAIYYLHRRDHMMRTEKKWRLGGTVLKETEHYFKVRFDETTLPTIGSQGFLIKKQYVEMIKWSPLFFHIDANADIIRKGYDNYIILKETVVHNHSDSYKDFIGKIRRNSKQLKSGVGEERSYSYNLTMGKMIKLGLTLGTFIIPLIDSIKGWIRYPSAAWFLHPIVSFQVAVEYTLGVLSDFSIVKKIK